MEITTYAEFYDFLMWCTDNTRPNWFNDWAGTPETKEDPPKKEWFLKNEAQLEKIINQHVLNDQSKLLVFVEIHHFFRTNGPCPRSVNKRKFWGEGSDRMLGRITPTDIITDEELKPLRKKKIKDEELER